MPRRNEAKELTTFPFATYKAANSKVVTRRK